MARAAAFLGVLALLGLSGYAFLGHWDEGDAFAFSWGPTAAEKREQARELADFKLDQVAGILTGVHNHTGSYWTGDLEWNREIRMAWATDTSYCVELHDLHHGVFHRRHPGPADAQLGACPRA